MAKFSKNTLTQVAGFDGQILAQELVYNQKDFWNFAWNAVANQGTWNETTTPIDLTLATIDAQIIRRQIVGLTDTRTGLDFTIADYVPTPTPVDLTITNIVGTAGTFTMVIDDTAWGVIAGDPELDIDATTPVCFTGRVKISFPAAGIQPAYDEQIFLLFLIVSDGVVNN